jgi:hypothetical protein
MESHLRDLKEVVLEAIEKRKLPRFLYKYRPLNDFTNSIISNSSFWFARADSFNDPFDCNLTEERKIKLSDFKKYITKLGFPDDVIINNVELAKRTPSIIRDQAIKSRTKTINSYGLLALSENFDSILMWSHYAENHTGLVLCLDLLEDPDFFISPLKVNYQKTYNPVNFFGRETDLDYVKKIIATKSKEWEYEQEIRIMKGSVGEHSFNKSLIKKVYFGCKCEPEEKLRIKNLFKANGYDGIKFLESSVAYGKFNLSFSKYT